ncbi:MAG: FtsQ-type POTRA domain-containing protein [Clostridia bacterium]|nr:FtsQ-type POTRA domain-containing protein [Clostridia bacterium]
MKYKRLLVIMTCLLFITVAVFCVTSAFKITDVELSVTTIESSSENVKELATNHLKEYEGKNLLFVKTDSVKQELESLSGYLSVEKVEKQFPNKLTVVVKERRETFSILFGSEYLAVDNELRLLDRRSSALNNVDGITNIILKMSTADYNVQKLEIGKVIEVYDQTTKTYLLGALEGLSNLRENVKEITVTVKKDGFYARTLTLKMTEGVVFNIEKANEHYAIKLQATLDFYNELSLKTTGVYYTVYQDGGSVTVKS